MIAMDVFNEVMKESLVGEYTHSSVIESLEGLSHNQAIEKPIAKSSSIYEILFHMLIWQDTFLKNIKDEVADWGEANRIANDELVKEVKRILPGKKWEQLVDDFKRDFKQADMLLDTVDLSTPMKTFRNKPRLQMYCILNQHNSYHMGQIIKNRVAQGTWPLKKSQ
jgi:uncharacterized damage-inducible protein DinB